MTSLILTTLLLSSPGPGEVLDPFSSDSHASTQTDSQTDSPDQGAPIDPFAPAASRTAPTPDRSEILDPFAGAPAPQTPIPQMRVEPKDPFKGAPPPRAGSPRPRLDVPFVDPFAGLEAVRRSVL